MSNLTTTKVWISPRESVLLCEAYEWLTNKYSRLSEDMRQQRAKAELMKIGFEGVVLGAVYNSLFNAAAVEHTKSPETLPEHRYQAIRKAYFIYQNYRVDAGFVLDEEFVKRRFE